MWDFTSSSKTSVWACFMSQNGFNWCLISCFHIVFYFPWMGEALKEFSGLGNTFLLQLDLNPGLELMRFANFIHSLVQKSLRWVRKSIVFVGVKDGECFLWRAVARVDEHGALWESWGDAVFSPWQVLLESCRSPFGAQHVRHNLQTITKQPTKRIKELAGQELNLLHTQDDEN